MSTGGKGGDPVLDVLSLEEESVLSEIREIAAQRRLGAATLEIGTLRDALVSRGASIAGCEGGGEPLALEFRGARLALRSGADRSVEVVFLPRGA